MYYMRKYQKSIIFWILYIFLFNIIFFTWISFAQNSTNFSTALKDNFLVELNKEWFDIKIKNNITSSNQLEINNKVEDLTIDNDQIYSLNKNYLNSKIAKKEELMKNIDKMLNEINTKEIDINSINQEYKKYIEIEEVINSSDYVYILALPLDKFLIKEDKDWKQYLIITRNPELIFKSSSLSTNTNLQNVINEEISSIQSTADMEEMKIKMDYFKSKFQRDYSPLFIVKDISQFFEDLNIKIAFRDNIFIQNYSYKNKEFMHSLYYLPTKLQWLKEQSNNYFLIYIPISNKEEITNLLQGLSNQLSVYKTSPEFCFKISYDDKYNTFENLFCWISETFWNQKAKVQMIPIFYKNKFIIELDRLWIMSIIYTILLLIISATIPFYALKYVDKILKYSSKLETESI